MTTDQILSHRMQNMLTCQMFKLTRDKTIFLKVTSLSERHTEA